MSCQTLFTRSVFRYCILLYSKTFCTFNRLENEIKERKRKRTIQGIFNSVLSGLYTVMLPLKRTTGCAELLQLLINLETQADVCVCVYMCIILLGLSLLYSVHLPLAVIIPCSSTEEL